MNRPARPPEAHHGSDGEARSPGELSGYLPYSLLNSLLELDGPLTVGLAAAVLAATAASVSALAAVTAARRDIV